MYLGQPLSALVVGALARQRTHEEPEVHALTHEPPQVVQRVDLQPDMEGRSTHV